MENEQTEFEGWLDEYDRKDQEMRNEQIEKHLDEYLVFSGICQDNHPIDEEEIPLLWTTWCIRRRIK